MIKNIELIIKIISFMLIIFIMLTPTSNASTMDATMQDADDFLLEGENTGNNLINQSLLQTNVNDVYNLIFTIGVVLSVLIGAILGIKFMIGSVEEQAKIKETLIPYAVGCIVVFGAFGIWKVIITMGGNIFG